MEAKTQKRSQKTKNSPDTDRHRNRTTIAQKWIKNTAKTEKLAAAGQVSRAMKPKSEGTRVR